MLDLLNRVLAVCQKCIARHAWLVAPWSAQVEIINMTESEVTELLYVISQESETAYAHIQVLCALCGVASPPELSSSNTGHSSVPSNAATPLKDS